MIPLHTLTLVIRSGRLRDRYPGGWEQFARDFPLPELQEHGDPLVWLERPDDRGIANLLHSLQQHGLRLARNGEEAPDIAFLQPPFMCGPVAHCPWLHVVNWIDGPHAAFIGVPDARWHTHRIRARVGRGDRTLMLRRSLPARSPAPRWKN